MIGIVGYSGFVGSNLLQFYKFDKFYNSKNFEEAKNTHFDILYFCGIPAVKWHANKYPDHDFETINRIKTILNTITCNKIILISTIDVYEITDIGKTHGSTLNEDYDCNFEINHTYGRNRYLFEKFISDRFQNHHIIRLPALFGKGLKKNIIYDLIHNNQIENIPYNSAFQWYNLDRLSSDIDIVVKNNIKVCNLFTEPLDTKDIIQIFNKVFNKDYEFQIEHLGVINNKITYDILTKYSGLFGSIANNYICDKNIVLRDLETYLNFAKLDKSKLCISNICVNQISQLQFAHIVKLFGIRNIQIAPTKLIEWDNLEKLDLSIYTDIGLNVFSFQSITYTLDHLNIFSENNENLSNHLKNVIDCAVKHKVKVLVFGCPKNRKIIDFNTDNNAIFVEFFKHLGDYCQDKDVTICLENNSKKYNCNFINTIDECANLIRQINKPNIKMMVDLGNAVMENDSWFYLKKHMDILYNVDIAHEYMRDFSELHESHSIFKFILDNNHYNYMKNLEMLIKDENEIDILCQSLSKFIGAYANGSN